MPNLKSAIKQMRQNDTRRLRNKAYKSEMRTQMKKLLKLIEEANVEKAKSEFSKTISILDKIARKNILHPNNVNHKKISLQAKYNRLLQEAAKKPTEEKD